ncbi:pyridoxamine 5'-phosphate oxidase family protein [Azospirillum thermophilum]|uniref:Pyridoxamine 5'-phosphate oxidase N-terminal domain-containing protein n=1 Tax=Azospirillum thermophilum TaxID=2202148 RepID=A0A2S2CM81_9PROT|nr:pyridoxamine 5'-phosphate oxidase family protein [Azospirillum thermophilum]AWK85480.1 hypothetical protein DEW08_04250 [Azospirillum thermophilum]
MHDVPAGLAAGPFHTGELIAQERAGVRDRMAGRAVVPIRDHMPDQHREFFAMLPFLAVGVLDEGGWPAAGMLVGPPGFATSPDARTLRIAPAAPPAGIAPASLAAGARIGLLGLQLSTRRRNRANGRIAAVEDGVLTVAVEQSFGNCPQYIQRREHRFVRDPAGPAAPVEALGGLDAAARAAIVAADTVFVASASRGAGAVQEQGIGVDVSHRGGRPGFIALDGDTLCIPDYRGNNYFNTLGNFAVNPRAGLLVPDFASGDLLHLSGTVALVWDGPEARRVPGAERIWRLTPTAVWRARDALPLRWFLRDYAPTSLAAGIWGETAETA